MPGAPDTGRSPTSAPAAARDHVETLRSQLRATTPVAGLEAAHRNSHGVAIEENLVLSVDASALPREHLGPDHQSHTGIAVVMATGVLNDWAARD